MSDPVRYDVSDAVATITLNRPEAMNSLDIATKQALVDAVTHAADDQSVRCVVLTGSGRGFSVGQDLREHEQLLQTMALDEVWATVDRHYTPIAHTLATMAKPVIAAVNGIAAGAGMSLALACDLRIAADVAGFNTAFTGVGLSCDTGSSWTLQRIVGAGRAVELLLMPRTVKADEALAIGLVHRVVPADELSDVAHGLAARLAAGPTIAYGSVKASVAFAATHNLAEALGYESQMMARTGATDDHRDAVAAFMAKEQPTFRGH